MHEDDSIWEQYRMRDEPIILEASETIENGLPAWLNKWISFIYGDDSIYYVKNVWVIFTVDMIWFLVALVNVFTSDKLISYGIYPRLLSGTIIAILLHYNFIHFLINVLGFTAFGMYISLRENGIKLFVFLTLIHMVFCGLFVWVCGRPGKSHVTTSGLIYMYYGYLVTFPIVKKNKYQAFVLTFIFFLYLCLLWGTFHLSDLSWEGHLFGFVLGWFVAYMSINFFNKKKLNIPKSISSRSKSNLLSPEPYIEHEGL